jgi:hypothetical protein
MAQVKSKYLSPKEMAKEFGENIAPEDNFKNLTPEQIEREFNPQLNPDVSQYAGSAVRGALKGITPTAVGGIIGAGLTPFLGPEMIPAGMAVGSMYPLAHDVVSALYNKAVSKNAPKIKNYNEIIDPFLSGIPEAKDTLGRTIEAGAGAATSVGSTLPAFATLAKTTAPGVMKNVYGAMASQPGTQMAVAPVSGATQQYVTENTKSPTLGFLAGLVPSLIPGIKSSFSLKKEGPSLETIKTERDAAYQAVDDAGVEVNPTSFKSFLDNLTSKLQNTRYDPDAHKETASLLKYLNKKYANSDTSPIRFQDLDTMHQQASDAVGSAEKGDSNFSNIIRKDIKDYQLKLSPEDITTSTGVSQLSGPLDVAKSALKKAQKLASAYLKNKNIQEIIDASKLRDNPENYIRTQFTALADDVNGDLRFYSPEEQQAIKSIAGKSSVINRFGENFTPSKINMIPYLATTLGPATIGLAQADKTSAIMSAVPGISAAVAGSIAKIITRNEKLNQASKLKSSIGIEQIAPPSLAERMLNPKTFIPPVLNAIRSEESQQEIPRININTSPKYAAGGPVYTHPAISSIRAKRAMRSIAR